MFYYLLVIGAAIPAYVLGSLNGAIITSKVFFRKDIRDYGSGNPGLTNFYRVFGTSGTLLVIFIDIIKTIAPVFFGGWIFGIFTEMIPAYSWSFDRWQSGALFGQLLAGFFVILGHCFPMFYGYKGGKGVMAFGAIVIVIDWRVALIAWGLFLLVVIITRYVSLGSVIGSIGMPIAMAAIGVGGAAEITMAALCSVLITARHIPNIVRICKGQESKVKFGKAAEIERKGTTRVTVFGTGAWGTAIALLLNENGHDVVLWSKFENEAKAIKSSRKNALLNGVEIPADIHVVTDLDYALDGVEYAVIAVPSFALRDTAVMLAERLSETCNIVCLSKGIEKDTSKLSSDILREVFGKNAKIATVSGPTHAEEVARKIPTACVAASEDMSVAILVQNLLMNEYFRVYTSTDVIGVELGAALKNVIAIAAGTGNGLGFGDNTLSMLITRGLAEIAELCVKMGGRKETLAGLAGLGDLVVTCISPFSRNRKAGIYIGQGMEAKEAMSRVGAVVEGYYAAMAAKTLSEKMGVELPICLETYKVLYEEKSPIDALGDLMGRSRKSEQSTGEEMWVR